LSLLISIDDFDCFREVGDFPARSILDSVVNAVKNLDEREELEPFIRTVLYDSNETPHGPAELVDILTHKVSAKHESGMAAFVIKGKSFQTVRPAHVAHQIYRLEKIAGLRFAVFVASGTILDEAKEQFCSTAERIGCYYAIFDAIDLARLFVAYGFFCPRDSNRIVAGRCRCGYSPKKRILNILQKESIKALNYAHSIAQAAGVVILPTGVGKTRIAAEDAKLFKTSHILYVAHTHEILDVAESELEAVFSAENVSRIETISSLKAPKRANVSTIQFIQRNLRHIFPQTFDYLVIDEFHHAAAKSYRQLIEKVEPIFLLGLTATPFRGDRQDILELCNQNVLVNFELRTGIDMGILSPYHYFGCFDDIDYSRIRHNGIRYEIRDLERALIIAERDSAIIAKWKEKAEGKPTIAFCCSHRHAQRVAKSFTEYGIPAEPYLSNTDKTTRHHLLTRFQDGRLRVLCVVDVLNEGADIPFVECLLFLRPTESKRIFYQQLGRGLRRFIGKSHCTVVDFIGNFKNAYRIVEYQGLLPVEYEETTASFTSIRTPKEVFNLPLGCQVHFDDRVVDVFVSQSLDPKHATRYNIGRILIYQYQRLARRLGHTPSKREVDRNLILGSDLYSLVFGGWKKFEYIFCEQVLREVDGGK
jgi:superfamily II DNA or RNA helicase